MNLNYTFQTPDHGYDIIPNPLTGTVTIKSEFRDALEELVGTIELAGVAEGKDFSDIVIEEEATDYFFSHYIEIDLATLALYLQFEVLNYMGSPAL
jgi:hypothetical protein